ncbi:MAG: hypothetical protein KC944_07335 [Candidatus Omnitrophica bacterium]|nr:hypothetical protein [Candidatus Omnitrophota bacterium]
MTPTNPSVEIAWRDKRVVLTMVLFVGCLLFLPCGFGLKPCRGENEAPAQESISAATEIENRIVAPDGFVTELIHVDEPVPESMVLLAEAMLGEGGRIEYDPEKRIVGLQGPAEKLDATIAFLEKLNETYKETTRRQLREEEVAASPWAQTAKYFGKLQPGESVQIEVLLLSCQTNKSEPPPMPEATVEPSRKEALEDVLLKLDERKRAIIKEKGSNAPEVEQIKEEMSSLLTILDREGEERESEWGKLVGQLEILRDKANERIGKEDPESKEIAMLRQEIIHYNQLLEEASQSPVEESTRDRIARIVRGKMGVVDRTNGQQEGKRPRARVDLPFEARMMGVSPEDLGLFAADEIETLGQTTLRATVFGNDSNGIAFTTISEYSLEFRLGHSTLGVTVALIPERKVRDQSKGIQGLVTRLNKILLDTETEVEIDRPIVIGGYTDPDGANLVLAVRIKQ